MSFLPDDLKHQSIKCPNCSEYISADLEVCKFCSEEISAEAREQAIQTKKKEKKSIYLGNHKSTMVLGAALLLIGILLAFQNFISFNFSDSGDFNCLTPALIIGGIVALLIGLKGYLKDR